MNSPVFHSRQIRKYVLITAAHNEQEFIEQTLRSVVAQTVQPQQWVIVSDGSTDGTDELVAHYAAAHGFIRLVRRDPLHRHDFGSKVAAIRAGWEELGPEPYDLVGILDADIALEADYYGAAVQRFADNSKLGVAGGVIYEEQHGKFQPRRSNRPDSIAGATQLFRRECYESVGGLPALRYGGEDWCAEVSARMQGWQAVNFPELKVFHLRPTGTASNRLKHCFREGQMDYSVGSDLWFEIAKVTARVASPPAGIGAGSRLAGFLWSWLRQEARPVSAEFIAFLRRDQRERLWAAIRHPWRPLGDAIQKSRP